MDSNDHAEHRQTAAEWHGGQSSALYAYASTGMVTKGLFGEIEDCLALVERGAVSPDTDVVDEHARLRALLGAITPEAAKLTAHDIGYEHGQHSTGWWEQDTIGGRTSGDTTAIARQVLQGIEDGDPAILDALPSLHVTGWPDGYTSADLAHDCLGPEPHRGDTAAHQSWLDSQPGIRDAYEHGFDEGAHDAVIGACHYQLDQDTESHPSSVQAALARLDHDSPAPSPPLEGLGL